MRRTQQHLKDALQSLIGEKPYHAIAVKEILNRANVGRSTFYTHFRDKDDLLAESIHDIFAAPRRLPPNARKSERLLAFSSTIFEHHERHQRRGGGVTPAAQRRFHEFVRAMIAELISDDLRSNQTVDRELIAQFVASTFILVLEWSVANSASAKEADGVFRSLSLPTLAALLD